MRRFRHFYTRCDKSSQLKSQILVQAKKKGGKQEEENLSISQGRHRTHIHTHTQ